MVSFVGSCASHLTSVGIELRMASDGVWYPFHAQEGEESFTSYYGESAQYFWEVAFQDTRRAFIFCISSGIADAAIGPGNGLFDLSEMINASAPADLCHSQSVFTQTVWDGAWHPLTSEVDEPRFAGY